MLVIAGGKGGVGRTTCALALGAALGRDGRDVLVVDADVRAPDLTRRAGLDDADVGAPSPGEHGLAAVDDGTPVAEAARSVPGRPGLWVLGRGERCSAGLALDRLEWSGPVVVDAPAGAGRPAARAIRIAGHAMLVATPTPAALRAGARTATACDALGTPPAGALLTRCTEAPPVEDLLGCPALAAVPPVDRPLSDPGVESTFDRIASRMG